MQVTHAQYLAVFQLPSTKRDWYTNHMQLLVQSLPPPSHYLKLKMDALIYFDLHVRDSLCNFQGSFSNATDWLLHIHYGPKFLF